MTQEIKEINLSELVLWTENPRDPINPNASDQEIVDKAINDSFAKWSLSKLAAEMGDYYDLSELPTVVYHEDKPIVYDGNRRMILGKIKHGLVKVKTNEQFKLPDLPIKIPCNVCDIDTALQNVYRKHAESGSWDPLERDIFLHKFMKKEKSPFLILEEETQIISSNPHLNQRFVKEEIFKDSNLEQLGFKIQNGQLLSVHNSTEAKSILNDISRKVGEKVITTRKSRGKIKDVLSGDSQGFIEKNKSNEFNHSKIVFAPTASEEKPKRQAKRTTKKDPVFFGRKLLLKSGNVNDFQRDILDLYEFYVKNRNNLSSKFPNIVRMALRLLCETAAKESNTTLDKYVNANFGNGKKNLDKDLKTTLSTHNVNETSIIQLLHVGAHTYQTSPNMEQTIAISIIIGEILELTHGHKR